MKTEDSPLKEVWEEIKAGKNIGVYVAVLVLFVAPLISLTVPGFTKENLMWTVLTAVMVILLQIHWNVKKLSAVSDSELLDSLNEAGLEMFYPKRRDSNFEHIIENAQMSFDSIGTSLPDISHERCRKLLRSKIETKPNLKVRILLVNPYSQIAYEKSQSNIYKDDRKDIVKQIENSIEMFMLVFDYLEKRGQFSPDRYDVRLYSTIPTVSCVFNDEILDIAIYDEIEPATITPAWKFRKNDGEKGLYNYYKENFETIWNDERTISVFSDREIFEKQRAEFHEKANAALPPATDSADGEGLLRADKSTQKKIAASKTPKKTERQEI